jgi:hypothetical protein
MRKEFSMNRFLRALSVAFALCLGLTLTVPAHATGFCLQDEDEAGGFAPARVNDPEVVASAKAAVSQQASKSGSSISLVSIDKAKQQVVAGMNYEMCLTVKIDGETTNVTAVVYVNLQKSRSLRNWVVQDCGD